MTRRKKKPVKSGSIPLYIGSFIMFSTLFLGIRLYGFEWTVHHVTLGAVLFGLGSMAGRDHQRQIQRNRANKQR
ncbi:hypothetical protein [Tatumella sp. OPLPL6]|uniref:hypothetical protein n=1 Tax=Tatumella sp. OPLPL6 TaxID=1928657 RepID=UPI000C17F25F|nr:hypothetical protein [Tatumella sp. OPLPL6]PIJ43282.1 hypothetical protein BOM24_08925 [Tatumella sp. OPLPL6]